jgi:hypothetical protein
MQYFHLPKHFFALKLAELRTIFESCKFFADFSLNDYYFSKFFVPLQSVSMEKYGYLCTKIDDEQMDSDGSDPADECRHVGTDESGCNSIG